MELLGNMMRIPLLINSILTHALENRDDQQIVTALDGGGLHTYTYREFGDRVKDLAVGIKRRGAQRGHRVATLA